MSKIDFIMPVYQVESDITDALNAVFAQTVKDFQVICVDDGSPDGSAEICDAFALAHENFLVVHKKNQGSGPTRNMGIALSSSDYLIFPDADDRTAPEMAEKALTELEAKHCDTVIFGNYEMSVKNGKETDVPFPAPTALYETADACRKAFWFILQSTQFNTPWNKIYKRSIVVENKIQFPPLRRAQDSIFNMLYYEHVNRVSLIPDCLYYYRVNTSDKVWKKFPKDLYEIDIYYDTFIVEMFRRWGEFHGEVKDKTDRLFMDSIYKTIGFYRNPKWNLSKEEKLEYVRNIAAQEHVQKRFSEMRFSDAGREARRLTVLSKDPEKIISAFQKKLKRDRFYESKFFQTLSKIKQKLLSK